MEWCVEQAKGRVPVIAGAGSNSTAEAIEPVEHAEKAGADAVLVVTPYYNKPTQEGLYQHFKAINDAIGIPIIMYNIPARSMVDISVDTMKRLYELKNIAGVKDATANMARVSQQRAALGEDFNQLSGEDITALGFDAHGGHGCISVTSNVAPRLCSEFQARVPEGRLHGGPASCRTSSRRCTSTCLSRRIRRRSSMRCRCSASARTRCGCRWCRLSEKTQAGGARRDGARRADQLAPAPRG